MNDVHRMVFEIFQQVVRRIQPVLRVRIESVDRRPVGNRHELYPPRRLVLAPVFGRTVLDLPAGNVGNRRVVALLDEEIGKGGVCGANAAVARRSDDIFRGDTDAQRAAGISKLRQRSQTWKSTVRMIVQFSHWLLVERSPKLSPCILIVVTTPTDGPFARDNRANRSFA